MGTDRADATFYGHGAASGDAAANTGTSPMRFLFGMVVGAALTAGAAFLHDTWTIKAIANETTATAVQSRPMVNWDVVNENWRLVSRRAREAWTALSQKVAS